MEREKWVTITHKLPPDDYDLYAHCRTVALELTALEGDLCKPGPERERTFLRRMMVEWLEENQRYLEQYLESLYGMEHAKERMRKMERMRMDGWACKRCGRTGMGTQTLRVSVHHIWPKGQFETHSEPITRPSDIHALTNLISLCSGEKGSCHDWAHRSWRHAAPELYELIGNVDAVLEFKSAGYGYRESAA